ncbi:MAG: glycosyltransferase [Campylobacterales bacterium]|nr:glycosyltransferase [Campylobacterales bacterium]HEO98698.1 glycosyltransferase [Campylobacterota bacterium]
MNLAPIVLFCYNRPDHTRQTIEALQKNELAKESELFIFSDAAKNEDAVEKVNEVRRYIKAINGFKKVTVTERGKNWGLADSIIDGVTKIINEYGKIIVLEDDLVTSPYFLKFMNEALEFYKNEKKVWHISGWNYPIKTDGLEDVFFWRLMNCWGWATWSDRWSYFERDIDKTIKEFSKADIKKFNLDDAENFWQQVMLNKEGKINTWAIFWYATIFKQNGLCLNPIQTFVENIGHDGSGIHCSENNGFINNLSKKKNIIFIDNFKESKIAIESLKDFYWNQKRPLLQRVFNKINKVFR